MARRANAAIHYVPDNYSTSGPKLMGKGSANENFLRAFVRHSGVDDYYCYSPGRKGFDSFSKTVDGLLNKDDKKAQCRWISPDRQQQFAEPGCFYIPAPQIAQHAWVRRQFDQRSYSLCGLTHTISSQGVMGLFEDTIIAPTQEWDAIICTSNVVRKSIENVFDNYTQYASQRFGGKKADIKLQLPIIPLGVDCSAYDVTPDRLQKSASFREKLNIGAGDIVFLFVGRLSMHAKAHPAPMYLALQEAAKRTGTKVHLIQSGWFDNDGQKNAFLDGAKYMSPSVNHHIVDGRKLEIRDIIYHACDVFVSLSENIQETFGLTPLEAMAAGKPVIVTDWNGYRDTVRNGEDGITVPTLAPAAGMSFELGNRFETGIDNYDHYIGGACQVTSVDIAKCADACEALINDSGLRSRMGKSGRKRAEEIYDWKHIIARYQELWGELADIRASGVEESCKRPENRPANPLYDDPFAVFDSYPTDTISESDIVKLCAGADKKRFGEMRNLAINNFCMYISTQDLEAIFDYIQQNNGSKVSDIVANFDGDKKQLITRSIIWFSKVALVSIGNHNIKSHRQEQCLDLANG